MEYQFDIDGNHVEIEEARKSAPARAFLNRFPELSPDLKADQGCPLVDSALECGLTASFVLPIFSDPSQTCCIGVFECYTYIDGFFQATEKDITDSLWELFSELHKVLKEEGVCCFNAESHISSKNICGLEDAKTEIVIALEAIVNVNCIHVAQVWIAYEDDNHVAFSSSLDDTRKKQLSGLRLTARLTNYLDPNYKWYIDARQYIPLRNGKGLVAKTIENYDACFCESLCISDDFDKGCSCFTICLKNNVTHDLLYVLEFLWDTHAHYINMLESLFATLQTCLPGFKFASGAQLGDELHVIEVNGSTGSENRSFKILKGNRSSSIPDALDEGERAVVLSLESLNGKCKTAKIDLTLEKIKEQHGRTMKEAAKKLNVHVSTLKRKWNKHIAEAKKKGCVVNCEWPGPNYNKRKVNDLKNTHSGTNDEDNGAIEDTLTINRNKNAITIKAEYADDKIKFDLPISSATFGAVEKKIGEEFKLNPGTYKLKYRDEDNDWILLNSDEHMKYCIKSLGGTVIRLLVTNSM